MDTAVVCTVPDPDAWKQQFFTDVSTSVFIAPDATYIDLVTNLSFPSTGPSASVATPPCRIYLKPGKDQRVVHVPAYRAYPLSRTREPHSVQQASASTPGAPPGTDATPAGSPGPLGPFPLMQVALPSGVGAQSAIATGSLTGHPDQRRKAEDELQIEEVGVADASAVQPDAVDDATMSGATA